MEASKKIAILILAAGESKRMGEPKQLLPWKDGTLLENAIKTAKASDVNDVYVILGANSELIKKVISKEEIVVLDNPKWKNGLGSSIAKGIRYLVEKDKIYNGVLVMLGDQPFITPSYLNQLIQSFKEDEEKIIATDYGNKAGVPALFGKTFFQELGRLNDDFGAKKILEENNKSIVRADPKGNQLDLDTQEEYKTWFDSSSKPR